MKSKLYTLRIKHAIGYINGKETLYDKNLISVNPWLNKISFELNKDFGVFTNRTQFFIIIDNESQVVNESQVNDDHSQDLCNGSSNEREEEHKSYQQPKSTHKG